MLLDLRPPVLSPKLGCRVEVPSLFLMSLGTVSGGGVRQMDEPKSFGSRLAEQPRATTTTVCDELPLR